MTTPEPTPAIEVLDLPAAVVLHHITTSLAAIATGRQGLSSPDALIAQGIPLTKGFRAKDATDWARMAVAMAQFWENAARFQPHLAKHELAAREALRGAGIKVVLGRK